MKIKVLVAYASKYGSTQEVAEAVAATLREGGLAVDLQPMRKVRTLAEYGAVVLGAPLYIGRWHKDAHNFLSRHREALTQRPVAFYTLGPTSKDEKEWQGVRAQLDQELAKYPWLKPVALELFGGKYDPAKLRFPDSLIASLPASPLHNAPASDVRHWTTIRIWASNLAPKLLSPGHLPVLAPPRGPGCLRPRCRQDGQPALPQ
jgi:menaquinone-dependent protoporphyrinogen oxidase